MTWRGGAVPRVAFVNGGILGLLSYAAWLRRAFADSRQIDAEHFVLSENLTLGDRLVRRVLCQRLLPNVHGLANLDLTRFRREYNNGLVARRRLLARGLERFDVLHFHHQAAAYASLDLMERVPTIVTLDCTQTCVLREARTAGERWSYGFNVRRDGEIFARAGAIVSASRWAADDLRRMYPDCRVPIHVHPHSVRLDLFESDLAAQRRARASRPTQCVFMGGDFPRKGGYDLLDAWRRGRFADRAELTLVTNWEIDGPLPLGVRQARGVRAMTPEWISAWRDADLFVLPTRNEAFGMVFQEAGAAGLPSVGTRLNAVPEIVSDGETGLLVTPGAIDELAGALDRLISSADLRFALGAAARRKIEADCDQDRYRERLVRLIYDVATHG